MTKEMKARVIEHLGYLTTLTAMGIYDLTTAPILTAVLCVIAFMGDWYWIRQLRRQSPALPGPRCARCRQQGLYLQLVDGDLLCLECQEFRIGFQSYVLDLEIDAATAQNEQAMREQADATAQNERARREAEQARREAAQARGGYRPTIPMQGGPPPGEPLLATFPIRRQADIEMTLRLLSGVGYGMGWRQVPTTPPAAVPTTVADGVIPDDWEVTLDRTHLFTRDPRIERTEHR